MDNRMLDFNRCDTIKLIEKYNNILYDNYKLQIAQEISSRKTISILYKKRVLRIIRKEKLKRIWLKL